MIGPVSRSRPVDVLRQSSDQIRRAAALLAEIAEETSGGRLEPHQVPPPSAPSAGAATGDEQAARDATILQAQRSFVAGLRAVGARRPAQEPDQTDA